MIKILIKWIVSQVYVWYKKIPHMLNYDNILIFNIFSKKLRKKPDISSKNTKKHVIYTNIKINFIISNTSRNNININGWNTILYVNEIQGAIWTKLL